MTPETLKNKTLSVISEILEDDSSISLRAANRLIGLRDEIRLAVLSDSDDKTIKGSPDLTPGTVTIQMNGIPDPDGAIESALRKIVFETVNEIIEKRADPEISRRRKAAYDVAQKYRGDDAEDPE